MHCVCDCALGRQEASISYFLQSSCRSSVSGKHGELKEASEKGCLWITVSSRVKEAMHVASIRAIRARTELEAFKPPIQIHQNQVESSGLLNTPLYKHYLGRNLARLKNKVSYAWQSESCVHAQAAPSQGQLGKSNLLVPGSSVGRNSVSASHAQNG